MVNRTQTSRLHLSIVLLSFGLAYILVACVGSEVYA